MPTRGVEIHDLSPNLSECGLYKLRTSRAVFAACDGLFVVGSVNIGSFARAN